MQITRNGAGFALPMTIVSLTVLGLLAATGYLVSWMDLRSARAQSTGTRAYFAAEAGIATALAQVGLPPPSRAVAHTDGSARVLSTRLLGVGARGGLYLIASTGSVDDAGAVFSRTLSRVVWAADAPVFDAAISVEPGALPATVTAGAAGGAVTGFPPGCTRPPGAAIVAAGAVTAGSVSVTGAPPVTTPGPGAT
ncbi:MAG: pilus assembly PilX N-terminal domain-containing protein, partial [Gemmatimonadota bacterium]|nr:pilus assembly PilX N-terminal domain-containing protein [Gemmatimonadota bacterium]